MLPCFVHVIMKDNIPFWQGLEYTDYIPKSGVRSSLQKKGSPGYDTKLHVIDF